MLFASLARESLYTRQENQAASHCCVCILEATTDFWGQAIDRSRAVPHTGRGKFLHCEAPPAIAISRLTVFPSPRSSSLMSLSASAALRSCESLLSCFRRQQRSNQRQTAPASASTSATLNSPLARPHTVRRRLTIPRKSHRYAYPRVLVAVRLSRLDTTKITLAMSDCPLAAKDSIGMLVIGVADTKKQRTR